MDGIGSTRGSRVGSGVLAEIVFPASPSIEKVAKATPFRQHPRPAHRRASWARSPNQTNWPLRRDAIGQRVGMKLGVIAQTVPRAILLGSLRYSAFLTRSKVVPGIVARDRQERPRGTFQVLH